MLENWKRSPFLRLLVPFVFGIACSNSDFIDSEWWYSVFFFALILFVILHLMHVIAYKNNWLYGIIVFLGFACAGAILFQLKDPLRNRQHFTRFIHEDIDTIIVRVAEDPRKKKKTTQLIAQSIAINKGIDGWTKTIGKLSLSLPLDSASEGLKAGDQLLVVAAIKPIQSPAYPGGFDYKLHQKFQGIRAQAFVSPNNWRRISETSSTLSTTFIEWREQLISLFDEAHISGNEKALLEALVLGKSDGLDREIMSDYAASGTIHILAVSGLHVGLIYVLIAPLTRKWKLQGRKKIVKALVPMLLLWIYAAITGFSPSVLRSALMFSFFLLAEAIQKRNNVFNSMSASAFALLCIDPYLLFSIGFVLSYSAVIGIVVLQKGITQILFFSRNWINKIWQLTAVSLAAQISTLPITLFFFHRFPNYFLLANLVMIPLSTIILYSSLALLALVKIPFIGSWVACFVLLLVKLLNALAHFFSQLPGSVSNNIHLTITDTLILGIVIVLVVQITLWQKRRGIPWLLATISLWMVYSSNITLKLKKEKSICLYFDKNAFSIAAQTGAELSIYTNDSITPTKDDPRWEFWRSKGITRLLLCSNDSMTHQNSFALSGPLIEVHDQLLLLADSLSLALSNAVDVVVIHSKWQSHFFTDEEMAELFCAKRVVLCGLSKKKTTFLCKKLEEQNVQVFTNDNGSLLFEKNEWLPFRSWKDVFF